MLDETFRCPTELVLGRKMKEQRKEEMRNKMHKTE
jgi:hypothetical protein